MKVLDLLPCPFCGSAAEFEREGTQRYSCIVQCTMCGCSLETGETWNSSAAWNQRVPPPPYTEGLLGTIGRLLPQRDVWNVSDLQRGVAAAGVNASAKQIYNALGYLTRKSKVRRRGYGRYSVTVP